MAREQVFVDALSGATGAGVGSVTVTVTPAYPDSMNRVHVIAVSLVDQLDGDYGIASVTVGGVAATLLHSLSAVVVNLAVYAFRFPPKAAHNVVVTFNVSTVNARVYVYELEGVDPTLSTIYKLADTAVGTAASDQRALTGIQGVTSVLIQANALWLSTLTTTATPTSPFASDDSTVAGSSPTRVRGSSSSCSNQAGPNVTPKYTYATSRAFRHAAYEFAGEPLFPLASLCGMGF